ncbi:MAG: zeta toxin family protein [Patescibacteria group bacterium]
MFQGLFTQSKTVATNQKTGGTAKPSFSGLFSNRGEQKAQKNNKFAGAVISADQKKVGMFKDLFKVGKKGYERAGDIASKKWSETKEFVKKYPTPLEYISQRKYEGWAGQNKSLSIRKQYGFALPEITDLTKSGFDPELLEKANDFKSIPLRHKITQFSLRTQTQLVDQVSRSFAFTTDYIMKDPVRAAALRDMAKNPSILGGFKAGATYAAGKFVEKTNTGKMLKDKWVNFYDGLKEKGIIPTDKAVQLANTMKQLPYMQNRKEWEGAPLKDKMTKYLGETLYNLGPSLFASVATYAASPSFGFSVTASSTAYDVKEDAIRYGVDEKKAENLGLITGLLVASLDKIVPDKAFSKNIKNKFIGNFAKRIIKSNVLEAGTEMGQENIQILAEATFRDDLGWDEIKTRNAMAALGGLAGGSAMESISTFSNTVQRDALFEDIRNIKPGFTVEEVYDDNLMNEAKKYKTAEDFIVAAENKKIDVSSIAEWSDLKFSDLGKIGNIKTKSPIFKKKVKDVSTEIYEKTAREIFENAKKNGESWAKNRRYESVFSEAFARATEKLTRGGRIGEKEVLDGWSRKVLKEIWTTAQYKTKSPSDTKRALSEDRLVNVNNKTHKYKSVKEQVKIPYAKSLIQKAFDKDLPNKTPEYIQDLLVKLRDEEARAIRNGVDTSKTSYTQAGFINENLKQALDNVIKTKSQLQEKFEYNTPAIIEAREKAMSIPETINIQTEERNNLRDKIVREYYGTGAKNKNRRADLVLGVPASGKSTFFGDHLVNKYGSLLVDSDQIKKMLPEYENGIGASSLHLESAMLADDIILSNAIQNGDNVVLPRLGKNEKTMIELINLLNDSGYDVHLHYMDLPIKEAVKRIISRFNETGRFVDPQFLIEKVDGKPKIVYNAIKSRKEIRSYEAYSNDVPKGTKPKLIEKSVYDAGRDGRIQQSRGDQDFAKIRSKKEREIKQTQKKSENEYFSDNGSVFEYKEMSKEETKTMQQAFGVVDGKSGFSFSQEKEEQYKQFKKLKLRKLDEIEDATQLKEKYPNMNIDNILYSQEQSGDEVFDDFKDRLLAEREAKKQQIEIRREKAEKNWAVKLERSRIYKTIIKRRKEVKNIKGFFKLSDVDLKRINGKDWRFMDEVEYKMFLDEIKRKAMQFTEKREAKNKLMATIQSKELKNTDDLRKAMKLPSIDQMTVAQMEQFNKALEPYMEGDVFLSQRLLETVENTELGEYKTYREVQEHLSKKLGVPIAELKEIKAGWVEKSLYDTALARKNPFYAYVIDQFNKYELQATKEYLDRKKEINVLVNKARKSRERSLFDKLIPTDKIVFEYLESNDALKEKLSEGMTKEELDLAGFLQADFFRMRNELIKKEALKKYRENYITHVQRGFLEAVKDGGLKAGFVEMFKKYKFEEAYFNIIDETGNVLALEKFFSNSLHRTGEVSPTQNVAKAYLTYVKSFEKKMALDSVIPEIMAYSQVLTKDVRTPRGLVKDKTLITFMKKWINNKKGRRHKLFIEQGNRLDAFIKILNSFITLRDLGFNVYTSIASRVGENVTNFATLGLKKYALGRARATTQNGRKISKQYENFIGENPFLDIIHDSSQHIGEKTMRMAFIGFADATYRSNKHFLLGSMTKEEYESGEISDQRLAELRREMGKYRVVEGAKSIMGSTTEGEMFLKYRSWAVPTLMTTYSNIKTLIKMAGQKKFAKTEFLELTRITLISISMYLLMATLFDDDDDSFLGKLATKAKRESMSLIEALKPTTWASTFRMQAFFIDLAKNVMSMINMEKYKTKEGYKGWEGLKKTLKPTMVSQIQGFFGNEKEDEKSSALPSLPKLPSLPQLPGLPALPSLPSLP